VLCHYAIVCQNCCIFVQGDERREMSPFRGGVFNYLAGAELVGTFAVPVQDVPSRAFAFPSKSIPQYFYPLCVGPL
jgi:hypothetical protein